MGLGVPPPPALGQLGCAALVLDAGELCRLAKDVRVAQHFANLAVDAAGHLHHDVFAVVHAVIDHRLMVLGD